MNHEKKKSTFKRLPSGINKPESVPIKTHKEVAQAMGIFKSSKCKVDHDSDIVEEASVESFPASDPPAWMITQIK